MTRMVRQASGIGGQRILAEALECDPLADPRQHIADWLAEHDDGGRACAGLRAVVDATEPIDGDDAYEFGYASAMNDVVTAAHEALHGEGE